MPVRKILPARSNSWQDEILEYQVNDETNETRDFLQSCYSNEIIYVQDDDDDDDLPEDIPDVPHDEHVDHDSSDSIPSGKESNVPDLPSPRMKTRREWDSVFQQNQIANIDRNNHW